MLLRHQQHVLRLLACFAFLLALATHGGGTMAGAQGKGDEQAGSGNLVGHGGPVHAVRLNADKSLALTGSLDNAMMVWDLSANPPKELKRFDDHEGWIKAVALLPGDARALAAEGGGLIRLWDLNTGRAVHAFSGHRAEVSALAVSPDGQWAASASTDRTARLWNLETLAPGPVLKGHGGPVNSVTFSGDGALVYTASYDGTIRVWASVGGEFKRVLYRHGFGINVLQLISDAGQIAFGSLDGRSGIVDLDSGEVVHEFERQNGPVLAMAFQDKPGLLAISGTAKNGRNVVGTIRVWRVGDWAAIEAYEDPRGPIWAMDFGIDGRDIYYGGKDDFVTKWQVKPRKPFEPIQGPIPRRFELSESASLGELQFARKCSLCHTLRPDGKNRAGPTLYNLFGRRVGSLPGYPYSKALRGSDIVWSEETIAKLFSLGPNHYLPGTKMPLQRIKDGKKIDSLIAYLKTATKKREGATSSQGN